MVRRKHTQSAHPRLYAPSGLVVRDSGTNQDTKQEIWMCVTLGWMCPIGLGPAGRTRKKKAHHVVQVPKKVLVWASKVSMKMPITSWWYQTGIPHGGKDTDTNSEKGTMDLTCQKDSGRPWAGLRSCAQTESQTPRGWRSLAGAQTHRQRTSAHRTPACSSLTMRRGRFRMQMLTGCLQCGELSKPRRQGAQNP